MSYTPIDPISSPLPGMDQDEFDAHVADYHRQLPTTINQMNTAGVQTDQNRAAAQAALASAQAQALAAANSAADAASAAAAASSGANATKWVSGTAYVDGVVVWSPTDTFPYRRIGAGAGTTDPKLDPSHWALQLFGLGLGGTTITGGVNLTATSPAAMHVTPTGPGLYAYLPDATTCPRSALQQAVYNAGEHDYGIRDYTGAVLGWIRPGIMAVIGLVDNSTAAGVWVISGLSKTGVTAVYSSTAVGMSTNPGIRRVTIDANRTLLLFAASAGIYAAVYDANSRTWGSALVRAAGSGSSDFNAVLSASNQVLMVSYYSTVLEAITLTLSGTTITPNTGTKHAITTSGSGGAVKLLAVPAASSWVTLSGSGLRAITVSGSAPSIGAAASAGTSAFFMAVSGSILRTISVEAFSSSSSGLFARPYTVSGNTLTPGTEASKTTPNLSTGEGRATVNGNGNIVVLHTQDANVWATVFKLTGTTEAVNSVAVDTWSGPTAGSMAGAEVAAITASKTLFYYSASTDKVNLVTDSSGTPTAGTALSVFGGALNKAFLGLTGTTARFAVQLGSGTILTGSMQIDCSGSSPSLTSFNFAALLTATVAGASADGARSFRALITSTGAHVICTGDAPAPQGQYGATRVRANAQLPIYALSGVPGASSNESWVGAGASPATNIYRVEAAE